MKTFKATISGDVAIYNADDKSVSYRGNTIKAKIFESAQREYAGLNRIHKPLLLLYWIDCKNGKAKNWV